MTWFAYFVVLAFFGAWALTDRAEKEEWEEPWE